MKQMNETKLRENKNFTKKNWNVNEKKNSSTWKNKLDFKKRSNRLAKYYRGHPQQIKMQSLNTSLRPLTFKENRLQNLSGRSKSLIEIGTEQQELTFPILNSRD